MTLKPEQINEINNLTQQKNQTIRPVSAELEEILYQPFYALDHGFVRVIDYMGNDTSVVQAARVSYGSGTKKTSAAELWENYQSKPYLLSYWMQKNDGSWEKTKEKTS